MKMVKRRLKMKIMRKMKVMRKVNKNFLIINLSLEVQILDKIVQLIVGLGNPGQQYEQTRHNAGASLISILSQQYASDLKL